MIVGVTKQHKMGVAMLFAFVITKIGDKVAATAHTKLGILNYVRPLTYHQHRRLTGLVTSMICWPNFPSSLLPIEMRSISNTWVSIIVLRAYRK